MKYNYHWYINENYKDPSFAWQDLLTKEECDQVIDLGLNNPIPMSIGLTGNKQTTFDDRKSKITWMPILDNNHWLFEKIVRAINYQNKKWWNYDLDFIESLQFTEYDSSYSGYYKAHTDTMYIQRFSRKLSFTIQLSDPTTYEGGDLKIFKSEVSEETIKTQGTIIFFPSFTLHEVTPVTNGTRYSLVGWVVGPKFK